MEIYNSIPLKDDMEIYKVAHNIACHLLYNISAIRFIPDNEKNKIKEYIENIYKDILDGKLKEKRDVKTSVKSIVFYFESELLFYIKLKFDSMVAQMSNCIISILDKYEFHPIILRDKLLVFLSHPMSNVSINEVYTMREEMKEFINNSFSYADVTYIENYEHEGAPENPNKLWHLGASIQQLGDADCIFFYESNSAARGVRVEQHIAEIYEIPVLNDILCYKR